MRSACSGPEVIQLFDIYLRIAKHERGGRLEAATLVRHLALGEHSRIQPAFHRALCWESFAVSVWAFPLEVFRPRRQDLKMIRAHILTLNLVEVFPEHVQVAFLDDL